MAVALNKAHYQEYVYDFAVSGGAIGAIDLTALSNNLPVGAMIKHVSFKVVTACTSGGSATIAFGNTGSATAFLSATAVASFSLNAGLGSALLSSVVAAGSTDDLIMTIATAALTAGKIVCMVEYVMPSL